MHRPPHTSGVLNGGGPRSGAVDRIIVMIMGFRLTDCVGVDGLVEVYLYVGPRRSGWITMTENGHLQSTESIHTHSVDRVLTLQSKQS